MDDQKVTQAVALLQAIARDYAPAGFAHGLGASDMVLLDLIARHAPQIDVFSVDTGRLPETTHQLLQRIRARYGAILRIYHPNAAALESFVSSHGTNAFDDGQELRLRCCDIRRAEPLVRALRGKGAWITGQRREQTLTPRSLPVCIWDKTHQLPKFSPLADWSEREVWDYLRAYEVPIDHRRGRDAGGCAPCSYAGTVHEARPWWWEVRAFKECGLPA